MLDMLQKFQLSIRAFAKYGCAERFHDLFDRDVRAGKLIFC